MDPTRIFSAEQIVVPDDLPGILKEWTKQVIRKNPDDVLSFSADYFKHQASQKCKFSFEELQKMRESFEKYNLDGKGRIESKDLKMFVKCDIGCDISDEYLEQVIQMLDVDESGYLGFEEIVNWWTSEK